MTTIDYKRLATGERIRMWLSAKARGDAAECSKLIAAADRSTVRTVDLDLSQRLDAILDAGAAVRMALIGPLGSAEALAALLAPTPLWPEERDEVAFPRLSLGAQLVELSSQRAIWESLRHVSLADEVFDLAVSASDAIALAARDSVEEMLSAAFLGSFVLARTLIAGSVLWCKQVAVDQNDFLTYSCGDLLDRLEALSPFAKSAKDRLNAGRVELIPEDRPYSLTSDLDQGDQVIAATFMAELRKHLPSLDAS